MILLLQDRQDLWKNGLIIQTIWRNCCRSLRSAFCGATHPLLIKSDQHNYIVVSGSLQILLLQLATSTRQAAEWRMHPFQTALQRMKDALDLETRGKRNQILLCAVHLFNLCTSLAGVNQILSTYMPNLIRDSTLIAMSMCS